MRDQGNQELIHWKDKQDGQTFNQTHQEEKAEDPIKKIRNKRSDNSHHTNAKNVQKDPTNNYLPTNSTIWVKCIIFTNIQYSNTQAKRNKKSEPTDYYQWNLKYNLKKLSTNKSPELDGLTGEFYQIFKEELAFILLKLSQKI